MDQRQLRALLAVGEHSSFSAAAKALHTVQSNISTHVSRLENELDVMLVDRASMTLTEEGNLVAARARRIEHELAAIESDIAALRDVISGSVRIGVIGTTARWLVPPLLESVKANLPAVRMVILDATTSTLVPQLIGGQVDLAVVNAPLHDPEISLTPLFDEDRLLVAPEGHPLFERTTVSFAELADHELLLEAKGTSFRQELDETAAALGVELQAQAEVDGMRLLASLAFSGFGAAILPASAAPAWLSGGWRSIPIEGIGRRTVALAIRRRRMLSAAEKAIAETVHRVITADAPNQRGIHPVP